MFTTNFCELFHDNILREYDIANPLFEIIESAHT
jgi:hypothetical protein